MVQNIVKLTKAIEETTSLSSATQITNMLKKEQAAEGLGAVSASASKLGTEVYNNIGLDSFTSMITESVYAALAKNDIKLNVSGSANNVSVSQLAESFSNILEDNIYKKATSIGISTSVASTSDEKLTATGLSFTSIIIAIVFIIVLAALALGGYLYLSSGKPLLKKEGAAVTAISNAPKVTPSAPPASDASNLTSSAIVPPATEIASAPSASATPAPSASTTPAPSTSAILTPVLKDMLLTMPNGSNNLSNPGLSTSFAQVL
jgi:hypothetical protein